MKHCKHCNKEFLPYDNRAKFCSKSCAAIVNNVNHPKRQKTKKCKNCETLITSCFTFCKKCINKGKHLRNGMPIGERTLGQELFRIKKVGRNASNRYTNIRKHAYTCVKHKERKCAHCNYDAHVELAHIKAISEFSLDTKIKEINNPNNLIFLCPNHHWEFDNLKLNGGAAGDRTQS